MAKSKQPDDFGEISQTKAYLEKIFEGEMFFRSLPTILLQIFCKIILNLQVIIKSPDNNFKCTSVAQVMKYCFTQVIPSIGRVTCILCALLLYSKGLKIQDEHKRGLVMSITDDALILLSS